LSTRIAHLQLLKPSGEKLDGDNPEHVTWVFEKSTQRAQEHKISGITYRLTQGVIKNIIPAIASTNAIIAGQLSFSSFPLFLFLLFLSLPSLLPFPNSLMQQSSCLRQ
jgi:hypothetical protein